MTLHNQIAFLRKQHHMTQEDLAQELGVTNQSVSKWESGQCCPDIQLLPMIADLFSISIDELLGHTPTSTADDILLQVRARTTELTEGEDYSFANRIAAITHAALFAKYVHADGFTSEDMAKQAGTKEWGYSSINLPVITTTMKRGTVLFSNNKNLILESEYRLIAAKLKAFADVQTLKILSAMFELTADGSFVSAQQIATHSETSVELVMDRLIGTLMPYVEEQFDGDERTFCLQGQARNILPILSMLQS